MSDHDVTPIRGAFTVSALDARRIVRIDRFSAAEAAALRLAAANPGKTFVICQEVARVAPAKEKRRHD